MNTEMYLTLSSFEVWCSVCNYNCLVHNIDELSIKHIKLCTESEAVWFVPVDVICTTSSGIVGLISSDILCDFINAFKLNEYNG